MPFFLTYTMIVGRGMSTCFFPIEAMSRHRELSLAGASTIETSMDAVILTLAQLESLVVPGDRSERSRKLP